MVMAAAAPWLVRAFASMLEARTRKRAVLVLARAERKRLRP